MLPDDQSNKNIYTSLENFLKNFEHDNWLFIYIFWEINLIKELGYGFKIDKSNSSKDIISVNIDNITYKIPKFIINEQIPNSLTNKEINQSLSFSRNLLLNKFYLPNNLFLSRSRVIFENLFS